MDNNFDCSKEVCRTPRIVYEDVNDKYPSNPGFDPPDSDTNTRNFDIFENNNEMGILKISTMDTETYGENRTMNIIIKVSWIYF